MRLLGPPAGIRPLAVRLPGVRPLAVHPLAVRPLAVRPLGVCPLAVRWPAVRPLAVRWSEAFPRMPVPRPGGLPSDGPPGHGAGPSPAGCSGKLSGGCGPWSADSAGSFLTCFG